MSNFNNNFEDQNLHGGPTGLTEPWDPDNRWPPEQDPLVPVAWSQTAWFIDPLNGKDGNLGTSPAQALKTFAALNRIWGPNALLTPTGGTVTVTLLSSAPATDLLNFDVSLATNSILVFQGGPPTETPLIVSVVRAKNRATDTPWAITTPAAAPLVLQRIRDVTQSTPGAPAVFIGAKAELPTVLRISEPVTYPGVGAQLDPVVNRFTPLFTDTFVAQTLPSFTPGGMTVAGSAGTVQFNDLQFDGPFALQASIGISPFLYGCIAPFGSFIQSGGSFLNDIINCGMAGPIAWFVGSFNEIQAGVLTTKGPPVDFIVDINCTIRLDIDVLLQGLQGGATVLTGTRWLFGTVGIFDSVPGGPGGQNPAGDGIRLTPGANGAVTFTDTDVTNQIWGSGNAGRGIYVGPNAAFSYDASVNAAPMTITGAGGNFTLAGTATSSAPPVNAPTGGLADTWAALFNPGTYPNGTAFDPIFNAWITPFQ